MEIKKQDKKQAKTPPVAALPVVSLTDKDMSEVNGGMAAMTYDKSLSHFDAMESVARGGY